MRQIHESGNRAVPFGSNAVRLSPRQWLAALAIIAAVLIVLPPVWERVEPLDVRADYRLPYRLGSDYWTFSRYVRSLPAEDRPEQTMVLGDSVIWGHYVARNETLSGHLNHLAGEERFANLGVDGIHPAAMAGLVRYYGRAVAERRVILHCNPLWMSSKRHDLTSRKEFAFNHPHLVPQFVPRIPCYRESSEARLAVAIGRLLPFAAWAEHVRVAYFDSLDLASWTVGHPYACPLEQVTLDLPSPDEPPSPAPDARPWTEKGMRQFGPAWVPLDESLQWASFRATVEVLRRRGCRAFVVVGPFNEHMLTAGSLETYKKRKREAAAWLRAQKVAHAVPEPLPSDLYADASHPLAEGYQLLAERLLAKEEFRAWIEND